MKRYDMMGGEGARVTAIESSLGRWVSFEDAITSLKEVEQTRERQVDALKEDLRRVAAERDKLRQVLLDAATGRV